MTVYSYNFTPTELAHLQHIADEVRSYTGKHQFTLDDVVRWCISESAKQFGLGVWPAVEAHNGGAIETGTMSLVADGSGSPEMIIVKGDDGFWGTVGVELAPLTADGSGEPETYTAPAADDEIVRLNGVHLPLTKDDVSAVIRKVTEQSKSKRSKK